MITQSISSLPGRQIELKPAAFLGAEKSASTSLWSQTKGAVSNVGEGIKSRVMGITKNQLALMGAGAAMLAVVVTVNHFMQKSTAPLGITAVAPMFTGSETETKFSHIMNRASQNTINYLESYIQKNPQNSLIQPTPLGITAVAEGCSEVLCQSIELISFVAEGYSDGLYQTIEDISFAIDNLQWV